MALCRASSEQSIKLSSTTTSDASNTTERHPSIETRVCLIGDADNDENLKTKLKCIKQVEVLVVDRIKRYNGTGRNKYKRCIIKVDLNISFVTSKDGHEYLDDDDSSYETVFIISDFESSVFNELKQTHIRILGPPVIAAVAQSNEPLPYNSRPLFCTCMQGLNLCFTNFKTKDHLAHLVTLCHYMGACIRKEMSSKIDYLVTNSLHGPKYRTAVSLGTPVMKEEWVHRCWAARNREIVYKAIDEEFLTPCKSKPFEGCILSFLGFSGDEKKHMEEQAVQQGGSVCEVGHSSCTHLVVEEQTVKSLPFVPEGRIYIIVQEWFWGSIQIEAKAAESMYIFELVEYPRRLTKVSSTSSLLGTPRWRGSARVPTRASTGKTSFLRKRLREETLAKLAQDSDADGSRPPCKRPSTDTSACIPDSMLDISTSASIIKSPSEIFSPCRRSDRLKDRRKIRTSRNSSTKSLRRVQEPDIFACVLHQNTSSTTPPALLNHFKELARGSPLSQNSSQDTPKKTATQIDIAKRSSNSSLRTSKTRRKSKSRKTKPKILKQEVLDHHATSDALNGNHAQAHDTRRSSRAKTGDLTAVSQKHRRYSMFLHAAPIENTRRRCSLISKGQFVRNNESEIIEEQDDTLVEDSVFNRTFVEEEDFLNKAIVGDEVAMLDDASVRSKEKVASPKAVVSARYQVAMEFLQTEKNYVGILQTILNLFKTPLDDPNQPGGQILASEEVKAIFGSLPEMEVVHRSMRDDLEEILKSWSEKSCVGKLVAKFAGEFGRCYPPFVNFFEESVETINRCDAKSPRFHAFLKINQAKKECGRQTLAELLINPVQRIPRIILLLQVDLQATHNLTQVLKRLISSHLNITTVLASCPSGLNFNVTSSLPASNLPAKVFFHNAEAVGLHPSLTEIKTNCVFNIDIKKHTERENASHPDVKGIESCLDDLKDVMAHINEDKRKTESQRQIFDIVYEVDGCPPTLVSSHRQFVARAEVIAVDDNLCNRGDHICLFVFSDCVEIAKRRRGVKTSSFKSPNVHARPPASSKPMKHVKLMSLLHIKKVVDIKNSEDCEDAFSLYCRTPTDTQDWLYTFKIIYCSDDTKQPPGEDNSFANKENASSTSSNIKQQLLNLISRHRTNALCKTNDDNFVCEVEAHSLDISTTDLGSTLGRAVRAAKKSSRKLTRAFSFSRTPRRAVQRAVSNLLSPSMNKSQDNPSKEEPGGSQSSSLTPSMSVTSLCTPQRDKRFTRLPSTSSLQLIEESMEVQNQPPSNLKSSVSTFNLARPPTSADLSDFPAIPTPPARKKKVGSSIKAATIALGRTGSFRRRKKASLPTPRVELIGVDTDFIAL